MTTDEFWSIVERSRAAWNPDHADGNQQNQLKLLRRLLSALPAEGIAGFDEHLIGLLHRAYRWDLWQAAKTITGGCSDDFFADFRGWVVSMGREVYEAALGDVETLASAAATPGVEDVFFEAFSAVPEEVYEEKTGRLLEPSLEHPDEPAGVRMTEEELAARFPRLWAARYRDG